MDHQIDDLKKNRPETLKDIQLLWHLLNIQTGIVQNFSEVSADFWENSLESQSGKYTLPCHPQKYSFNQKKIEWNSPSLKTLNDSKLYFCHSPHFGHLLTQISPALTPWHISDHIQRVGQHCTRHASHFAHTWSTQLENAWKCQHVLRVFNRYHFW